MFKGFQNTKYPDYEVILPQTHLSFNVRTLTVQEEEKLKGSILTPLQITEHLNECIFQCISKFPERVLNEDSTPSYDKFLKTVTLKDRDALLYGLYHISYGEIRDYNVICSSCNKEFAISVKASDTFNYNIYPYEEGVTEHILDTEASVPLKVFENVVVKIKQPTLYDEISAYKTVGQRPGTSNEVIIDTLPIVSFEETPTNSKKSISYTDKEDIIDAYRTLPSGDKKLITSKYIENFGKYGIELKTKAPCTKCGATEIKNIDLVEVFFSMVYSD